MSIFLTLKCRLTGSIDRVSLDNFFIEFDDGENKVDDANRCIASQECYSVPSVSDMNKRFFAKSGRGMAGIVSGYIEGMRVGDVKEAISGSKDEFQLFRMTLCKIASKEGMKFKTRSNGDQLFIKRIR